MMMTKQKKAVSFLLCIILLLTGLYGAAAEETSAQDSALGKVVVWKVVAPEFNTEALLDYTFDRKTAEQAPEIREEIRENNDH